MLESPTRLRRSHTRLFDEDLQGFSWRQFALCNLELACGCAAFVALMWLALQPDMENPDAPLAGAVLGDWVDGPSLRGTGVGSHLA